MKQEGYHSNLLSKQSIAFFQKTNKLKKSARGRYLIKCIPVLSIMLILFIQGSIFLIIRDLLIPQYANPPSAHQEETNSEKTALNYEEYIVKAPHTEETGIKKFSTPANYVIGQPSLQEAPRHYGGDISNKSLYSPGSSAVTSDGKLIVSDYQNHRVLIYNSIPTNNNAGADVVVGQPDFVSRVENNGGIGANTLNSPTGVAVTNNDELLISDYKNHRVLIYHSIPTTNGASADIVIGQPDFISNTKNNGGRSALSLKGPYHMDITSDDKLILSDALNNRVLIYNTIPTANHVGADIVLGQNSFNSGGGGVTNTSLNRPFGVETTSDSKLIISDYNNHRLLIYNSIPTTNGASADIVIGQPDFVSRVENNGGIGASSLNKPLGVRATPDGKLFIADSTNNRIIAYNTVPTTNFAPADYVVGQPDFTTIDSNPSSLSNPYYISTYNGKLILNDFGNHRVLIFNTVPTSTGHKPNVAVGQPDLINTGANQGDISFSVDPHGIHITPDQKLIIGDRGNNRVLIYNNIPQNNNVKPDVVLGQPNLYTTYANNGGVSSRSLSGPAGVTVYNNRLIVADIYNHRVLVFNSIPTTNHATADIVIGQPDFTSRTKNDGGVSASTLWNPTTVRTTQDGKLFVGDHSNKRVLIFNTIPTVNNTPADIVIGQPDFNTNSSGVSKSKMNNSHGVFIQDNGKLLVTDEYNNRVLIFNSIPNVNGAEADLVIGKDDFNDGSQEAPTDTTLGIPHEVMVTSSGSVFISENGFYRVSILEQLPTTNGAPFNAVLGQPSFENNQEYYNGVTATSMHRPFEMIETPEKDIIVLSGPRMLVYKTSPSNSFIKVNNINSNNLVELTLGADNAKDMMISFDPGFTGATWEPYATNYELSNPDRKNVYVKFRDFAHFESEPLKLDYTKPVGKINIVEEITNSTSVNLELEASDPHNSVKEMMICENKEFTGCTKEPYKQDSTFTFKEEGVKTIYAKFIDENGIESEVYSDTVIYDITGPVINKIDVTNLGNNEYQLSLDSIDLLTSVKDVSISSSFPGENWMTYEEIITLTLPDNTDKIYIRFRDILDNESELYMIYINEITQEIEAIPVSAEDISEEEKNETPDNKVTVIDIDERHSDAPNEHDFHSAEIQNQATIFDNIGILGLITLALMTLFSIWFIPPLFLLILALIRKGDQFIHVINIYSKDKVVYAKVKVFLNNKLIQNKKTDITGKAGFKLEEGVYHVAVKKGKFFDKKFILDINEKNEQKIIQSDNESTKKYLVNSKFDVKVGLERDYSKSKQYKFHMQKFNINIYKLTLIPALLLCIINLFITSSLFSIILLGIVSVSTLIMTILRKTKKIGV